MNKIDLCYEIRASNEFSSYIKRFNSSNEAISHYYKMLTRFNTVKLFSITLLTLVNTDNLLSSESRETELQLND